MRFVLQCSSRWPWGCPTAVASHSLSVCRRAVPLSAYRFCCEAIPECHPGTPLRRLPTLRSVRSSRRPPRARPGWPHPFPCRFQHIAPVDPVIQHVEPELRLLLGLLVQLLSQQREFIRQSVSARLFLQGFAMQPLFRSGNFFQAVLLSSYISDVSVRPLCSTGITPLPHSYGPLRLPARGDPSVMYSLGSLVPVALPRPAGSPRFLD